MKKISLISKNLFRRKTRLFLTVSGVSVGIATLLFFLALSNGVQGEIITGMQKILPLRQIEVSLNYRSVGVYKVPEDEKIKLNVESLEKIKNIDGVVAVSPQNSLMFPASLTAIYANQSFETDAGVFGIEREIIAGDIPESEPFEDDEDVLPVVLNIGFVNIANTILETNGLPMVNKDSILNGFTFDIKLNKSSFISFGDGQSKSIKGRIVGFSNKVKIEGITIPLKSVERLNKMLANENPDQERGDIDSYKKAYVIIDSTDSLSRVSKEINEMGFKTENKMSEVNSIFFVVKQILLLLSFIILFVSLLGVLNTLTVSVFERKKEIGILRAIGASKLDILKIFLGEAFFLGILGGIFGVVVSYIIASSLDSFLLNQIGNSKIVSGLEIASFFKYNLSLSIFGILFGGFVSLLAGIIPAWRAISIEPSKVLSGRS